MIRAFLYSLAPLALSMLVGLTGCGEPDRADYRDSAADEVCDEAERCDNLDELDYESHSERIIEERSRFNDMWPADECGDGQIDPEAYDRCMDRATLAACDGDGADFFAAWSACRSEEVCIR